MRKLTKWVVVLVVLAFAFSVTVALAAEAKKDKQWYVNQDKNGKCSVHQQAKKTKTTILGPYETKDKAQEAKKNEPKCATKKK